MIFILDRFTAHLKHVLLQARDLASHSKQAALEPMFLLQALEAEEGSIGREILYKLDMFPKKKLNLKRRRPDQKIVSLLPLTKKIIERAVSTAEREHHHYVGTEHLLYAMITTAPQMVATVLHLTGRAVQKIKHHLEIIFENTKQLSFPALFKPTPASISRGAQQSRLPNTKIKQRAKIKTPTLDFFTKDMTALAEQHELDTITGREEELERLIQILLRRTKNNAIILGDPGVGKTALVEGLAAHIALGNVPALLLGKRILTLDLGGMVAGTMYRGEFEGRIKDLLHEIENLSHEVILFIDEIHMIVGSGSTTGSGMDAANLLKPALAKGDLHVIGATTHEEYKKYFENDGALERRFQPLHLAPPTIAETKKIMTNLAPKLAAFHHITIPEAVIDTVVEQAAKHIHDRAMPDKAIDLLEEAAALLAIHKTDDQAYRQEKLIEQQLLHLMSEKQEAIKKESFNQAEELKQKEEALIRKLMLIKAQDKTAVKTAAVLSVDQVFTVLSHKTKVPKNILAGHEVNLLDEVLKKMSDEIVGQDINLERLINTLKRSVLGLKESNRPLGSFILVGPTGTGKTMAAKLLAEHFFCRENTLIRLDMSEFRESFNLSKLTGSPPGYVGYREKTSLTDMVKSNPHAVVLFETIEKAHPDVLHLLLGILNDGELRDATGRLINFRHTIIILTSNAGSELFFEPEIGFHGLKTAGHYEQVWQNELAKQLPPELLARLDSILVFQPLAKADLARLANNKLAGIERKMKTSFGLNITFDQQLANNFANETLNHREGARAILRQIETSIEEPLADWLIKKTTAGHNGKVKRPTSLFLASQNGKITISER